METDGKLDLFLSSSSNFINSTVIYEALGKFSVWFWNPDFWLPVNFTWDEIQPREDFKYPDNRDILTYPFFVAAILLTIRYWVTNPYVFYPIARYYHLNLKRPNAPKQNKELERLYNKFNRRIPQVVIDSVSEKLKWGTSDVQKWLTQRRAITRLTAGEKFADSGFMLLTHLFFSCLGLYVLHDKEWVWDISHCWYKYPHHEVDGDVWFYYIFGLGLYLSVTFHQLLQPSRKDTFSMYLHHFFTMSLMCFSWTMNFVRVGTLVLFTHQFVDWLLVAAKLLHFIGKETMTNIMFAITFVVWIITRLLLFPIWILRSSLFDGPTYMFMPSAYLFYTLMFGLFLLNLMWMAMMIIIIVKKIKSGKLEDVRSSNEYSEEEEEEEDLKEKKQL